MKKLFCICFILVLFTTAIPVSAAEKKEQLPSGIAYSDIESSVDAYVTEHKKTTAAVSVAVFTGDKVLMNKAYGYTDIENAVINDDDTVFEWGSCSKLLVWTSVMQLVESGKIDLNQDIRTYLPTGFLKKLSYEKPITMLNLMNHNAGWQETVTDLFYNDKNDIKDLGKSLQMIEPDQVHEPGTVVSYSNWGCALAGYIVERVSKESYSDYVQDHIFKPLRMEHTSVRADMSDNEWVAGKRGKEKCYSAQNESLGTCIHYISLYPAGMAVGTLSDFVKFAQTYLTAENKTSPLFQKAGTLDTMLSPSLYFSDGTTARNCHGFWTDQYAVPVLWHNGGTIGSSCWFAFNRQTNTGMIILTNQSEESIYNCGLLPFVFGSYQPPASKITSKDISGIYLSSRTCYKGYAKLYSLICLMQIKLNPTGNYSITGTNYTLKPINKNSYLVDMGKLKQYFVFKDTNQNGQTTLQLPGSDYTQVSGYHILAELILLLLFILAAIYSLFALFIWFIRYLRYKIPPCFLGKCRIFVNSATLASCLLFIYITMELSTNTALIQNIRWCIVGNALLSLVPIIYLILLILHWKKADGSKKDKFFYLISGLSGLVMTINVIVWQAYKFW